MILPFSTHHRNGEPTLFEERILLPYVPAIAAGYPNLIPKVHTFRLGQRWQRGMKMHMAIPNRTKAYRQFNAGIPELEFCNGQEPCVITWLHPKREFRIEIGGVVVSDLLFMANDGFDKPDLFLEWFSHPFKTVTHIGQIVHFTSFRYGMFRN